MVIKQMVAKQGIHHAHQHCTGRPVDAEYHFKKGRTLGVGIKDQIPIVPIKTQAIDQQEVGQYPGCQQYGCVKRIALLQT